MRDARWVCRHADSRLAHHTPKRHISLRVVTLLAKFFTSGYVPVRIMPDDEQNRFGRSLGEGYSYVALGFTFAVAILAFGALGWVVDGWLGTRPRFALVGAALGGFGGVMAIYYRVKKDTERRDGEAGKGKR